MNNEWINNSCAGTQKKNVTCKVSNANLVYALCRRGRTHFYQKMAVLQQCLPWEKNAEIVGNARAWRSNKKVINRQPRSRSSFQFTKPKRFFQMVWICCYTHLFKHFILTPIANYSLNVFTRPNAKWSQCKGPTGTTLALASSSAMRRMDSRLRWASSSLLSSMAIFICSFFCSSSCCRRSFFRFFLSSRSRSFCSRFLSRSSFFRSLSSSSRAFSLLMGGQNVQLHSSTQV